MIRVWHENMSVSSPHMQHTDIEVPHSGDFDVDVEDGALYVSIIEGEEVTLMQTWAKDKWIGFKYTG